MIKFFKMDGIGNDYIFIDNTSRPHTPITKKIIKKICDRHYGVGGDGVIVLTSCTNADVKLKIYNHDASEAKLCGNATRCVAFYMSKKLGKNNISIKSGEKTLYCQVVESEKDHTVVSVSVGKANLVETKILAYRGQKYKLYIVDVGNLHCVTFVKDFNFNLKDFCEKVQNLECFSGEINVDVACVKGDEIDLIVYERGSGFTLACGSGACASAFVSHFVSLTNSSVTVCQKGGKLGIEICEDNIVMSGECEYIFDGVYYENK